MPKLAHPCLLAQGEKPHISLRQVLGGHEGPVRDHEGSIRGNSHAPPALLTGGGHVGGCWEGGSLHIQPQRWQIQLIILTQKYPTCCVTLNGGRRPVPVMGIEQMTPCCSSHAMFWGILGSRLLRSLKLFPGYSRLVGCRGGQDGEQNDTCSSEIHL